MDTGAVQGPGCWAGPGSLFWSIGGALLEREAQFREHTVTLSCGPANNWASHKVASGCYLLLNAYCVPGFLYHLLEFLQKLLKVSMFPISSRGQVSVLYYLASE